MYTVCIILYVILVHVMRIQLPDGCSNCPHFQLITAIPAFGIYLILLMSSLHETAIVSELERSK